MNFLAFAEGGVQLFPDFSMFVHIAIISLMVWILNRTFFKPINKILSSRNVGFGGQFKETGQMLRDAEQKESAYKEALLDARNGAYEMIEAEKIEAVANRQAKVAEAKQEISARVSAEMGEIEKQTAAAKAQISEDAKELAEKITSNVLKVA
ncbi:MAG: hypothetical protein R2684_15115 [Pyrinomonadaceae bacterium]